MVASSEENLSILLLSLPSYYSIDWAREFTIDLKRRLPDVPIVVGGRWVVKQDGKWIKEQLPGADLVVYGTADNRIVPIVHKEQWPFLSGTDCALDSSTFESSWDPDLELSYDLMDNYREYHPSLEVSRGCGKGCAFCEERHIPLSRLRDPQSIIKAAQKAVSLYDDPELRFYFEASWFAPDRAWGLSFEKAFSESGLSIQWRCETRADVLQAETLEALGKSGLKVIDVGLESASHRQLTRMKKTSRPQHYLRQASDLLQACHDNGIWAKVNVLLYAGEDNDTLAETLEWLQSRKGWIKGVSAGPVVIYGRNSETMEWVRELKEYGAAPIEPDSLLERGYAQLHLSPSLTFEEAQHQSLEISRCFMTARDYYDLKAFTYLPRKYSFEEFCSDGIGIDKDLLPYAVHE